MNVEIRAAANGWWVGPTPDWNRPNVSMLDLKDCYVFETFEALTEWLKVNVVPLNDK